MKVEKMESTTTIGREGTTSTIDSVIEEWNTTGTMWPIENTIHVEMMNERTKAEYFWLAHRRVRLENLIKTSKPE